MFNQRSHLAITFTFAKFPTVGSGILIKANQHRHRPTSYPSPLWYSGLGAWYILLTPGVPGSIPATCGNEFATRP